MKGNNLQEASAKSDGENQTGSGVITSASADDSFIEKIANLVSKKISATNSGWQNFNLNPPGVTVIAATNTTPPLTFDIAQSDNKHDLFDTKRLIKTVPSQFKHKAEVLVKEFTNKPHSLNWNSDGVIFLDDVSIPNSDIFTFFPYLFKGPHPKHLPGFNDFVQKIHDMGLSSLIKEKNVRKKVTSATTSLNVNKQSTSSSENWWYLGP